MMLSFSLGISKSWIALSTMQLPGFYWINSARKIDAERFCQQIISNLSSDARAAIICQGEKPHLFLTESTNTSIKLPLFTLPEKKAALFHLTTDLMRSLNTKRRLFIVLVNSSSWELFDKAEIQRWVQDTSKWLNNEQSTMLILAHGSSANQIKNQLISQHRFLDGISFLKWQQDCMQYEVTWWATETGLIANQNFIMNNDDQQWTILRDNQQEFIPSLNDEFLYLAESTILEGSVPPSEHWQLFTNNTLLVKQAEQCQAATIIFSIYNNNQIDELARQIHHLRRHCGEALKIVVREMSHSIRYSDERLLLACGVNLTIPQEVVLPKFLTMLDSIQGQRYTRHVPEDFSAIMAAMHSIEQKGYLPLKEFSKVVLERVYNTLLPENGKGILIELIPEAGVPVRQALSLCDLKRLGDIVTIAKNHLFLFLSTCAVSDLDTALNYIFLQPVNVIFSSHVASDQDLQIITEMKQLNLQHAEPPEEEINIELEQKTSGKSAPLMVSRRTPECINLSTTNKET